MHTQLHNRNLLTSVTKFAFCLVSLSLPQSYADITLSANAPVTDILATASLGTIDTSLFPLTGTAPAPITGNDNHARGQLFSLDDSTGSAFEISAITFQKNQNQTFSNDLLTLRIFQGAQSEWDTGNGHVVTDTSFYNGTTVTPLYEEIFTVNGAITNGAFITLELATPLEVDVTAGADFGFFMTYDPTTADSPDRFRHREANDGGRLSISTTSHATSGRSINHFVQGTVTAPPMVSGNLELGSPFQNRMILQRDKPIKIWGTAEANAAITVNIASVSGNATADAAGAWEVELPASPTGGPHTLDITSTTETTSASEQINDVLFGDVWFCFGQSNMRWRFNNFNSPWETFYTSNIPSNDNIRYLRTIEDGSLTEQEETQMTWLANSGVNDWSAIASVFAYQLNEATGVPVAIIDSSWGSSSIEGWMPKEFENDFPHFKEMLSLYQSTNEFRSDPPVTVATRVTDGRLGTTYSSNEEAITALSGSGFTNSSQANIFMRTRPNIIYNERVHPLLRFGISGFIWYQGEANSGNVLEIAQYQFSLPRMVEEYRERFGQGDLPFLGVQHQSFNINTGPGIQWFRESQDSLLEIPNAYIAVTVDTGAANNIHPSDKEEIGIRLALLAQEHALNENIESDSPRYASHTISGNQVTLTFDHAAGLTTDDGNSPAGFEVAGADGVYHDATSATISGESIIVSSSAEPAPISVRYAWEGVTHTLVNVYNGAAQPSGSPEFNADAIPGLPLAPFRTDTLPVDTLTAQAPFANEESYSTPRDTNLTISTDGVLANDFDLNLDPLEASIINTTSNGTLDLLSDGSFTYIPEEGFAGVDSFTYQATEASGLASPEITVTITVEGTPSAYYQWRQTIAWEPGDDQTSSGDPDNDGLNNFLEYAFASNPLLPNNEDRPRLTNTATGIEYHFNNTQVGVLYEVLLSTNLEDWSDTPFVTLTNVDTTPVAIPDSEVANGKIFVRLRVSSTE